MHAEDKEIIKLKKALPNEKVLQVLDRYKKEYGFADYYGALDSMAYKLGFSWGNELIADDKTNKDAGYIPFVNYSAENALNKPLGKRDLISGPYKRLADSKRFATKEIIYRLMRIKNIEKLVFSEAHSPK